MKLDKLAVLMNPPYQMSDGGHGRSAKPLYHTFIETIIDELCPDYLVSINPSRWMVGGKGLDAFRRRMMLDHRMKKIVHFPGDREVFPSVDIKGGVNYFLWDNIHAGPCEFLVGNTRTDRFLDEYDIIIQDNNAIPILRKVLGLAENWVSYRAFASKPFGLRGHFDQWSESGVRCYSANGQVYHCEPEAFRDKHKIRNRWKVVTSKARGGGSHKSVITNMFCIEPGAICTETYVVISVFDSKKEAESFLSYMRTKFFRFMLGLRALTQHITREKFAWVPDVEDYTTAWTDEELYDMFGLTRQERAYIESKIKELPYNSRSSPFWVIPHIKSLMKENQMELNPFTTYSCCV